MARQHGKRWLADVRLPDGLRLRPSFPTEAAADDWQERAKEAVAMGKPVPNTAPAKAPGRTGPRTVSTLGEIFDYVVKSEWSGLKSASTAILNGRDVVNFFGSKKLLTDIGPMEIADMRSHFLDKGRAPATVNRKTAALSKLLHVAEDIGAIDKVPKIKTTAEAQTRFRSLDIHEERALLAYWKATHDYDLHDLCALLLDTGARCFSELIPVRWDHFHGDLASVTFWETKTNQPRTVPLTARSRAILKARRAMPHLTHGPFSGLGHGGSVKTTTSKSSMRAKWDTMRATLPGMSDVTPHILRHTCCTRLILGGVDVKRVMTWMGHTAITTTMRYMQINPTSLEEVLGVLEQAG